jgi:predicted metalloendopeptidase
MEVPIRVVLGLASEPPPRWARCVEDTETSFPEAVDVLARPAADDGSGVVALEVARRVAQGLSHAVSASGWMDDPTREQARRKLEGAGWLIPLPAEARPPRPPAAITSDSPDAFLSLLLDTRRQRFEWNARHFDLARSGAVGFTRRTSDPLALYQFGNNVVEVSPTLFEAPFLGMDRPAAVNFAVFGTVVGHELAHALGASGRAVGPQAQWRDWWSEASAARYAESSVCMAEMYGSYEIAPATVLSPQPLRVNGVLTLEENIADLGGLAGAYEALAAWRVENPLAGGAPPGVDEEQLFFIAYAQLWCQQMNPGALVASAYFDNHAPGHFRVNGPLSQFPPFARAFACPFDTPMVAKPHCGLFGLEAGTEAQP